MHGCRPETRLIDREARSQFRYLLADLLFHARIAYVTENFRDPYAD
jgi:hypothetical protein